MLDQGELDWKVLAINEEEARKKGVKNIEDFNRLNPGAVKEVTEWFKMYKTYEGKAENQFGYEGRVLSSEKTIEIIHENNQFYKDLKEGKVKNESKLWLA